MFSTMRMLSEVLVLMFLAMFSKASGSGGGIGQTNKPPCSRGSQVSYCLSWRVAVEANNVLPWPTVPPQCMSYVENYMLGGQYERDLDVIMEQNSTYLDGIVLSHDGMDAWILDIDDTCLSNLPYYRDNKRFGSEAYKGKSSVVFKSEVRKEIEGKGYRIWGNLGDQWSDLLGDCIGSRTFKLPNPMYFVP
ncbi:uncharacterized protein LOC122060571 [Macadamia integrifolia]|uniref:uncharacterized protein LOC122060571 n=1 Tax=Macadamia integrifolia TaxID=60698 RepID=UPI001C52D921|nr:uncharacterized protein LOC122060571 [Macadamia integrifolia]